MEKASQILIALNILILGRRQHYKFQEQKVCPDSVLFDALSLALSLSLSLWIAYSDSYLIIILQVVVTTVIEYYTLTHINK